jgi:mannose-6-phosphate isomerase-like protein (cupin superfamily)
MVLGTVNGYLVRRATDAPTVPCPCGDSTRILTGADGAPCSLHVTSIRDATRHYHRETTEVYYILEGSGKMELNGDWVDLAPGMVVWIEAGTRHRLVSEVGVKTVVFGIPAFNPADEYFD